MIKFPTVEDIIKLHDILITETGGSHGLRDEGLLRSAHGQPLATFGGVDLYPSLHMKAAVLLFSLIKNHPFVDGNKRTALLTTVTFLHQNGYIVEATTSEKYDFVHEIARSEYSRDAIADWLKKHTRLRSG